jgi:hypothetical protein
MITISFSIPPSPETAANIVARFSERFAGTRISSFANPAGTTIAISRASTKSWNPLSSTLKMKWAGRSSGLIL